MYLFEKYPPRLSTIGRDFINRNQFGFFALDVAFLFHAKSARHFNEILGKGDCCIRGNGDDEHLSAGCNFFLSTQHNGWMPSE